MVIGRARRLGKESMTMTSSSPALHRYFLRTTAARRQRISLLKIDLPDEIIELILSRCPVKSVVRFKSVSKSWQSIISDPRFSRIHHIQRSKLPENQNKFLYYTEEGFSDDRFHLIRFKDGKFRTESVVEDSIWMTDTLCSCDGLILFRSEFVEFILWNPLIGKHITIPAFNPDTHPEAFANWPDKVHYTWIHHLYFDSTTNDYKIVFAYEKCYTVYSCKNGSWGEIKDGFPCEICVDGCFYDLRNKNNGEIICFDARDGKQNKFPQPKEVEFLVKVRLEVVSGRLCLYGYKNHGAGCRLELWVMEDNGSFDKCWRKLISMEKVIDSYISELIPVFLSNEDDVVLWAKIKGYMKCKHFIYNPREKSCYQEIDFNWEYFNVFPYLENHYMPSS